MNFILYTVLLAKAKKSIGESIVALSQRNARNLFLKGDNCFNSSDCSRCHRHPGLTRPFQFRSVDRPAARKNEFEGRPTHQREIGEQQQVEQIINAFDQFYFLKGRFTRKACRVRGDEENQLDGDVYKMEKIFSPLVLFLLALDTLIMFGVVILME